MSHRSVKGVIKKTMKERLDALSDGLDAQPEHEPQEKPLPVEDPSAKLPVNALEYLEGLSQEERAKYLADYQNRHDDDIAYDL